MDMGRGIWEQEEAYMRSQKLRNEPKWTFIMKGQGYGWKF